MAKHKGQMSSPMTPIFGTPSPKELAGGSNKMDGEFGTAKAAGVIDTVIYTGQKPSPAGPLSTPFQNPIAKGKKR